MGGLIDWAGLAFVIEFLGISDIETLIFHLIAIRDQKHG